MNVHFISLGCSRNLVDTEMMLGHLVQAGHTIVSSESQADCVVVNTCSFIRPAVEESIDAILEMAQWKRQGNDRKLVVLGCLPERYRTQLASSLPEVDLFLGTGAFHQISDALDEVSSKARVVLPPPGSRLGFNGDATRLQTTSPHTAYLKIAEGCAGRCTYCIIPKLRGPQKSRPIQQILSEATTLAETGVKELILVAQNTTAYGHDLGKPYRLKHLLERLAEISQLVWIRVLYGHPDFISDSLIETMAASNRICSYFDIPVQHISEPILRKMGRSHNGPHIFRLFEQIRTKAPAAVLRTTLMVGFPGETNSDFERMLDFIERVRFDHMGAFVYSGEEDIPSNRLEDHVAEEVKQERFERLMKRQAEISRENNQRYVGEALQVLVEGASESCTGPMVGRAAFQAPDVDGVVHVSEGAIDPGSFATVRITEAHDYDLTGDMV